MSNISEGIAILKQKQKEISNLSENLAKSIEQELINIIKKTALELNNFDLAEPIYKFKVIFDQCADENTPTISYRITLEPKEKMKSENFVNFSNHFFRNNNEMKEKIGKERMNVALKIRNAILPIMDDHYLVDILVNELHYNHVTVDLTK